MDLRPFDPAFSKPYAAKPAVAQALAQYQDATARLADDATQMILFWQFEIGRALPDLQPTLDLLWSDIDTRCGKLDSLTKAIGSR